MTMAASYRQPFVKQKNSKTENSYFTSQNVVLICYNYIYIPVGGIEILVF